MTSNFPAGVVAAAAAVKERQVSAVELTHEYLRRISAEDGQYHSFLSVDGEGALAAASAIDVKILADEPVGLLAGVPFGIKDVLCTQGWPTTAGSRALSDWRPPYDATAVVRLRQAGAVVLGKTNCDEFAMGSSTEHSAYGPTRNPHDVGRVPGGSSGGSAAAVAAQLCAASVGTDTGGSVRQPAALCGVVGFKPTYGRISRYGLLAMASSLDTIGFLTSSVADAAALLEAMAGVDSHDTTAGDRSVPTAAAAAESLSIRGLKIGVPQGVLEGVAPEVEQAFTAALGSLTAAGAAVTEVSLPGLADALAVYYILMPAEVSANLARYDGVRYPLTPSARAGQAPFSFTQMVEQWRSEHLGAEVQRRILVGAYVLSAGYQDAYYRRALAAAQSIRGEFSQVFSGVDLLLTPTAPTTAFKLGEKLTDPLAMYLGDLYTVPASIAGIPAMSLPLPTAGLPVGLQIIAPWWEETKLLRAARSVEALWS